MEVTNNLLEELLDAARGVVEHHGRQRMQAGFAFTVQVDKLSGLINSCNEGDYRLVQKEELESLEKMTRMPFDYPAIRHLAEKWTQPFREED